MICNMTYLGHLVILTCGKILKMTFRGQSIYSSIRLDEMNTMVPILLL